MSFISAKCPNCGASIQVDNERKEAFCQYCGSKITVEEAVKLVRVDNSVDIANLLSLMKHAVESNNGIEGLNYANRVLEMDINNQEAWLYKMHSLCMLGGPENWNIPEVISTGRKIIEIGGDPEKVYSSWLAYNNGIYNFLIENTYNFEHLAERYSIFLQQSFSPGRDTLASDELLPEIMDLSYGALELRRAIPDDAIQKYNLTEGVEVLAKNFVTFTQALADRYAVCHCSFPEDIKREFVSELSKLKKGLPEEKKAEIPADEISKKSPGGCYIATAVYGSYEAPEVLVLRRFRDSVLKQSFFGRIFIKVYYAISPSLAEHLKNHSIINNFIKKILDNWVGNLKTKLYKS